MPPRRTPARIDSPPDATARKWAVVILGTITFFYLAFYFTSGQKRIFILTLFPLVDEVVYSWFDGDWSRFAILDRVPLVAATGLILAVAYVVGRFALKRVRADEQLTKLELVVFATGVGLNLISLYTLAIGLAGGLQLRVAFILPMVLVSAAALIQSRGWSPRNAIANLRRLVTGKSIGESTGESFRRPLIWMCIPFVVAIIAGALLPPQHFDTREYHSQVPREWYQQGAVVFMPHNIYGNMPLGAEMHAIVGSNLLPGEQNWWFGALVGKAVIGAYAPLTALALVAFGRRFLSSNSGEFAAFVFISTPWVMHVSVNGLNDGALAFYLFATFYGLMIWHEQRRGGAPSTPMLLLTGFLAGSAAACKYPGVLFVCVPSFLAILCLPLGKLHMRESLIFALAILLACGLWFGKNLALADNPTYPLLYSVFGGETRTAEKDQQWTTAHGPPHDERGRSNSWSNLKSSASLLLVRSEFASPILLPLAAMVILARGHSRLIAALAVVIGFNLLAWWFLTHRIDRFLVPILPLVALLAGIGATAFGDRVWNRSISTILCIGFAYNLMFAVSPVPGDSRFLTSYKYLRHDDRNEHPLAGAPIPFARKLVNSLVRPGYALLSVGEAQVFEIEVPVYYNTCFDDCVFETMMKGRTRTERLELLREKQISHVLIAWSELARYRQPGNYGYSSYVTRKLIQREFVEQGILREIPLGLDPRVSQIFEVVGWQTWDDQ